MTTDFSGTGDPARSVELLWDVQERPRRGPKPKLTVAAIVGTAIALADTAGLGAVSMRRIAEELGVSAMSIYTYVPGKAELIDVMLDRAYAGLAPPPDGAGWRAGLEHVARENWGLFHRHPWLLHVGTARPPVGPNLTAKYEHELRVVDGLGLTDVEMDSVVALVNGFAESSARVSVNAALAEQITGITDEEWWRATAPVLGTFVTGEQFPLAGRVGEAAGIAYNGAVGPEHAFEFGLARVLDGIAALIDAR